MQCDFGLQDYNETNNNRKKEYKPIKTLLYSKVRKQNKNQAIISTEQNYSYHKIIFIVESIKFVVFVINTLIPIFNTSIIVFK